MTFQQGGPNVSLSWYWDDRIFTYLCSFAVFGPAHGHCLVVPSQVSRFRLFCSLTWVTFILLVENRSNVLYIDLACFHLLSDCRSIRIFIFLD